MTQVLDFDQIFSAYMHGNQKTWEHDRSSTVGASEVFDCLRKIWFEKRGHEFGFEPDEDYEDTWGAMERGNIIENHYVVPGVRAGLPKGLKLLMAGDDQQTIVDGKSSATPDGLIVGLKPGPLTVMGGDQKIVIEDFNTDCIGFEIKSIDPRAVLVEERARHFGQTQVQMGLIRDLTQYKPTHSIILYIDASFVDNVTPFVVPFDQQVYESAKLRASQVWEVNDPIDVLPEGKFDNACKHCRWRHACGAATVESIPNNDKSASAPEIVEAVDPHVQEYLEATEALEKAQRRVEIAKETIKEELLNLDTRKVRGEAWSVSWYGQKGRISLDTKAMEAAGIDLKPFQKEGAEFDQLRITRRVKKTKE